MYKEKIREILKTAQVINAFLPTQAEVARLEASYPADLFTN